MRGFMDLLATALSLGLALAAVLAFFWAGSGLIGLVCAAMLLLAAGVVYAIGNSEGQPPKA